MSTNLVDVECRSEAEIVDLHIAQTPPTLPEKYNWKNSSGVDGGRAEVQACPDPGARPHRLQRNFYWNSTIKCSQLGCFCYEHLANLQISIKSRHSWTTWHYVIWPFICQVHNLRSPRLGGNFRLHMSAESPSNISPNPSKVISEVLEP